VGQMRRRGSSRPSGLKLRRAKISISLSFSNISKAFSNSFCTHFLLEIKTNHSQIKYAAAYMHKHVSNPVVDFNSMKIINFSRLKCSQNCVNKSNSPILK
jgi:hypothetical protein